MIISKIVASLFATQRSRTCNRNKMAIDKIQVSGDPRVQYKSANLNGRKYGYLLAQPESGQYRATIFLIHGFPDLSMGWRYQIPMLLGRGLQVVAPDCLGYGRTDAPEDAAQYSHKRCADDIKELTSQLGLSKIILGGHDWGAFLAYRIALWHPDLITHLFTVCVPYSPPRKTYIPLEEGVRTILPNFAYQLQFRSGEVEKSIRNKGDIKNFLSALYGGRKVDDGGYAFAAERGVELGKKVGMSRLLSEEELEHYVEQFSRNGLHGPLNWYRTSEINHKDELSILDRRIDIPLLFIQALRDSALPPPLGKGMARTVPHYTLRQVDTFHWALWERPDEVNRIIAEWLDQVVFSDRQLVKL